MGNDTNAVRADEAKYNDEVWLDRLLWQGIKPEYCEALLRVKSELSLKGDPSLSPEQLELRQLGFLLSALLHFDSVFPAEKRVVYLHGLKPTIKLAQGLARRIKASVNAKVGILSIGEKLKEQDCWCENLAIRKLNSKTLERSLNILESCDLVIIGTSLCTKSEHDQVVACMQERPEIEKCLVMSAIGDFANREHASFDWDRLLLTDAQKCPRFGPLLNFLIEQDKPLAYFVLGQELADSETETKARFEFEPATARRLAWLLFRPFH